MKLKFLAISDTHLGEETSLLCFPHGRRHLWRALRDIFGTSGEAVSVDELILLGDIPDRTLSSTSQVITQTNALMDTLGSALDVRRAVYIPGNHDHTLWTAYDRARHGDPMGSTPVLGQNVVTSGKIVPGAAPAAEELLSLFFGWPDGSHWRTITNEGAKPFDFVVANPIYAQAFAGRTYLFAHGTHFRPDVVTPKWLKQVLDYSGVDHLLGDFELESDVDLKSANNLAELEKAVAPFVDSLWPSSHGNPTSSSDQLWYLLTFISGKFGKSRPAPTEHLIASWAELAAPDADRRFRRLTPEYDAPGAVVAPLESYEDGSIDRCRRWFLGHALNQLKASGLPTDEVTFVYGDTHDGGVGRLPGTSPGKEVRVYNTGSWVAHEKNDHPPCHLFAVDDAGTEYLVDISFNDVRVDRRRLLALASDDAENKKRATSRVLRGLLSLVPR